MKILITGGAGYIGSHANRFLSAKGIDTVIIDDLSDGHEEAVICGRLVKGDFGDKATVSRLMREEQFDAVMHFAAFASVPDSVVRPARYYRNNVTNMQNLLDCCVENGVKYFVFSSSAATFGSPVYSPMDEDHPQLPINPYGMTKLIGEKMLADYERAYGLRYCAFRYFCAAGDAEDASIGEAHNPETHLIPVMIKAAISKTPFKAFGTDYDTRDGSCVRDFIHVDDLAEAHWLGLRYIMENDCSDCFNLGSGTGFTVLEKHAINMPCMKMITTRDDIALLLEKYIYNDSIVTDIVGDPALWIPECYAYNKDASTEILGINVICEDIFIRYGGHCCPEKLFQFYQQLVLEVEARGIPWMMFSNGLKTDQSFGEQILHSLGIPVQQRLLPRVVNNPDEYIKRVASFRSILGARLHACITAYSLDIPVVGLIWNPKLDLFAQITKQRDCFFDETELDAKTVVDAIQRSRKCLLDTSTRENLKKKTMLYIAAFLDDIRKERNTSFGEG